MNIDFHYGVIYVAARIAGLACAEAETVAHACQYVDDATTGGPLLFRDGKLFDRFASAHKLFDLRNWNQSRDERAWAPFHFLPAGKGESFEDRAVCFHDSEIARAVVRQTLHAVDEKPDNALHRMGVCLHAYVDTWAHEGFSGILSDRNRVQKIDFGENSLGLLPTILADGIDRILPLGHGAVAHYPDIPWLSWCYVNHNGQTIQRDNGPAFVDAVDMAVRAIRAFQAEKNETSESGLSAGRPDFVTQPGLSVDQKKQFADLFAENRDESELVRLEFIAKKIQLTGIASIKEVVPPYVAKGQGSWKYIATGIVADNGDDLVGKRPVWQRNFEESDYRKVHDAIKQHRALVTDTILPFYNMRLA